MIQTDLRQPQQIGALANLYAEGALKTQQTMMDLARQKQESEGIASIASAYQANIQKPGTDINGMINAGSQAVFGLAKYGQKAIPVIQAIAHDNTVRAEALKTQMEMDKQKPLKAENLDVTDPQYPLKYTPTGQTLVPKAWFNDKGQKVGNHWYEFSPTAPPGASTIAAGKAKDAQDLQEAQNTIAQLKLDPTFQKYYPLAQQTKLSAATGEGGDVGLLVSGFPDAFKAQLSTYQKAKAVVDAHTTAPVVKPETPKAKILTKEVAQAYYNNAPGATPEEKKKNARAAAAKDGYK
jgi:hypothetical protein